MSGTAPARIALFLIGIFAAIDESLNQNLVYNHLDAEVQDSESDLRCYDCNSAYDFRCGDPFDPYSIGILNCSNRKVPEHLIDHLHPERKVRPTVCRKVVQKIEGQVRIIRGCGYITDNTDNKRCPRRTGTAAVEIFYCACTNNLCNKGYSIHSTVLVPLGLVLAIINMLDRLLV